MKIRCSCKNVIIDQTDYLRNKGYLISDTQWFDFWDLIDNAIENPGKTTRDKENSCMQLRHQNIFKRIWECFHCGKLYIDGNQKGELLLYSPELDKYNGVLDKKV